MQDIEHDCIDSNWWNRQDAARNLTWINAEHVKTYTLDYTSGCVPLIKILRSDSSNYLIMLKFSHKYIYIYIFIYIYVCVCILTWYCYFWVNRNAMIIFLQFYYLLLQRYIFLFYTTPEFAAILSIHLWSPYELWRQFWYVICCIQLFSFFTLIRLSCSCFIHSVAREAVTSL